MHSIKLSLSPKAISIVGDEVFSFTMSLTPNATEGAAYADTSTSDGRVKLNVGCIQVVYLHRFFMSLLVSDWHRVASEQLDVGRDLLLNKHHALLLV